MFYSPARLPVNAPHASPFGEQRRNLGRGD
jgi:hypothetical protein